MAFKKGQSGNPKGKPPGTKNKTPSLLADLTALGLTPAQMLANSYALALKNGDYATAQKAADTAIKYCYAVPVDTPELDALMSRPAWLIKVDPQTPEGENDG